MTSVERQSGVDLARWIAFVGMVAVNFGMVMRGSDAAGEPSWMATVMDALSGRAASLFVVLAGLGLGWTARKEAGGLVVARRGLFLIAVGLGNALVFSGDILHFYGVWFLLAACLLRWPAARLLAAAVCVVLAAAAMITMLDYDAGWDWDSLTYVDFWTPSGMGRHLLFNGWHPVFPWFAFLLVGLALSRLDLARSKVQWLLLGVGASAAVAAQLLSNLAVAELGAQWADQDMAQALFGTAPIPPMPMFVAAGVSSACAVLGASLLLANAAPRLVAVPAAAGRLALTLYIAHIFVGMGTLEALGAIGNRQARDAWLASLAFCAVATPLAWLWRRWRGAGPFEALMRRVAG